MWTVFVGKNGLCKTTILQAIALAASGHDRANQLGDIIALPDRRQREQIAHIEAKFQFGSIQHERRQYPTLEIKPKVVPRLHSALWIPPRWSIFVGTSGYYIHTRTDPGEASGVVFPERAANQIDTDPLQAARAEGLPYWFVAGYGTVRSLPLRGGRKEYKIPVLERLMSLFEKGNILGTGFLDLFSGRRLSLDYVKMLQTLLMKHDDLLPDIQEITSAYFESDPHPSFDIQFIDFRFNSGKGVVSVPATLLSHGYQGTISWIADLIGQMFLEAEASVSPEEMEGLVLIDELDLHLHPQWQVGLVRALKETFPRIQFVATTHSPMILPGLERDEIFYAKLDEDGNVRVDVADQSPKLMTGSEIYDSFFGIDRLYPNDVGEALNRFGYLASNPHRSDDEDRELQRLIAELKAENIQPGWEPVPRNGKKSNSSKPPSRRKKPS